MNPGKNTKAPVARAAHAARCGGRHEAPIGASIAR
jgi:hypothetical protein